MHLGDRELEREFLAAHRLRDKLREMTLTRLERTDGC